MYSYKEIETLVFENEEELRKSSLKELYDFAVWENDFNTGIEYSRYKKALLEIGVDYDAMKEERDDQCS